MKIFRAFIIILVLLAVSADADARRKQSARDPYRKFQTGIWFGPITPVYTTADDVDTNLGGGLFIRPMTFLKFFKIGVDASYQHFESRGVNKLTLWPTYGYLVFRIPVRFPLIFLLKAGGGRSYVYIEPDMEHKYDPMFIFGVEGSFPAGRVVNIGLRIDYLLIYEKYIAGASKNGHIINTGITLYFNLF
jgi:hypothetical protein